jgi:diadenosine tetraphosphatase ApaH/serine/threonine PP2A family protein phosphatase
MGPKGLKNRSQHSSFLEQVGEGSARHAEYLDWFSALPLWLELGGLRVVHACWHGASLAALRGILDGGTPMTERVVIEANTKDMPAYRAIR